MKTQQFCNKLANYASKEPKVFLQLDGHYLPEESNNGNDRHDADGDEMKVKSTVELMEGSTVRILIPFDTDINVAVRQMKKLAKWLKRNPKFMDLINPNMTNQSNGYDDFEDDIPF
jgi:adenine C2-methylase RlmN of 23S rRNA A2503 and tRNA A37